MKYVFNPSNFQINPATDMTSCDVSLRDKVVSAELYALVCKGKVSVQDVGALFAAGKSPEVLVKHNTAVKDSPQVKAPENTEKLEPEAPKGDEGGDAGQPATAESAFTKGSLWKKSVDDLRIIAASVGVDIAAEDFAPTQKNLIAAILAKAAEAEAKAADPAPEQ